MSLSLNNLLHAFPEKKCVDRQIELATSPWNRVQFEDYLSPIRKASPEHSMIAIQHMDKIRGALESWNARHSSISKLVRYGRNQNESLFKIIVREPSYNPSYKVFLSAGVHGNEHLSTLTILQFLERISQNADLLKSFEFHIYPMVSPHAMARGRRPGPQEGDLNREFYPQSSALEARHLMADLQGQKFDLALDRHGGPPRVEFFSIRSADDNGLAEEAMTELPANLLLESNNNVYPGFVGTQRNPKKFRIIAKGVAESSNSNTLRSFLVENSQTHLSYTLEYPMRRDPNRVIQDYTDLVESFLNSFLKKQKPSQSAD